MCVCVCVCVSERAGSHSLAHTENIFLLEVRGALFLPRTIAHRHGHHDYTPGTLCIRGTSSPRPRECHPSCYTPIEFDPEPRNSAHCRRAMSLLYSCEHRRSLDQR